MGGELLILTGNNAKRWKEDFEHVILATMPTYKEAESDDSGKVVFIAFPEVAKVVKMLLGGRAPGVNGIYPEILKVLGSDRLSSLMLEMAGPLKGTGF